MKVGEKKAALLAITENIEMELFSSEEHCVVVITQEKKEDVHQTDREHPLVPDCEEDQEPQVETKPRQQAKPKTEPPVRKEPTQCPIVISFTEETEIEMEVFPPIRVSEGDLVEINSDDSSIVTLSSPNKTPRLKWKRLTPQRTGLMVKDVICLPREHYMAQLDRQIIPQSKERAALAAMGLTARITIDCSWSANQMENRLATLFQGQFVKRKGQRFSFTYLQCVQGSRVLFVPDTPAEGWTGGQVLRICAHGALYIVSHHDYPQAGCERSPDETPVVNRKEICPEVTTERHQDEDSHPLTLDLDTILRLFRQENVDGDVERHIQVRRTDLLHGALKEVRRPGFCFMTTPLISFSGEETVGHKGPLREFFRLVLLELQQSCVFEGRPGCLILTYDLTALEHRKYYEAGVLIGWSLAHGGPGPRCLHPALFQLMCSQSPSLEDFECGDIVDADVQIRLQELCGCTDVKLLSPSLCDWASSCGIPGIYSARSDEIPSIYTRLVKHYIYHRVASVISQFTEGLNSCGGLWDLVQANWEAFVPVMSSAQQQLLTLEEFKLLFTVHFSSPDSPMRAAEEATVAHWETVLALVNEGQAGFSFEDLLAFITGADHLPPLGFHQLISLRFYSQDTSTSNVRLPYASTCSLELFLPRGAAAAADLLVLLDTAVHEAQGFARFQTAGEGDDTGVML
ncbi:uncharacterized protein LOC114434185 [Parambassis ranga]|uniref:HECT-type E3 ubiquitin transferase n=1 Tax=Parambassis ranga TaxID=210632 RepID=A0A6P7HZE7_9TELE|nr:uncharacterized protein LOC114434185 [Parambassis ranga]